MLKAHANPNSTSDLVVRVTGYSVFFSSGEKLDLICVLFDGGPGIYVNKGQLLELDELFEKYGADVEAAEGVAMAGGYFNGKLYAIPDEEFMGRRYGFVGRQDILDKYEFDEYEDATYEDLDAFFARVKAGEGEDFYIFNNVGGVSTIGNFMLTLPLYHGGRKALLHAVPGVHDRGHMRLGETAGDGVPETLRRHGKQAVPGLLPWGEILLKAVSRGGGGIPGWSSGFRFRTGGTRKYLQEYGRSHTGRLGDMADP